MYTIDSNIIAADVCKIGRAPCLQARIHGRAEFADWRDVYFAMRSLKSTLTWVHLSYFQK